MRAMALRSHGDFDQLKLESDFPEPSIADHDVLVRVNATSVNRVDLVMREGYPGAKTRFPHVLGADIAGKVAEIGPAVKGFRKGDRILAWPLVACGQCELCQKNRRGLCLNWKYFGMHIHGSYAEYVAVPEESLIGLPSNISMEEAATLPVAGLTAYHALVAVGRLSEGETALIWGGSGGMGTFAVQIAKHLGAKVITTVGQDSKRDRVTSLGADLVLNHYSDDVLNETKNFTNGNGVELVFDSVGAQTFPIGYQLLKKGGRMLLCGLMTGREAPLSLHQTYLRHLSILGLYLGEKHELEALIQLVLAGSIRPMIDRALSLEEATTAHRLMAAGAQLGKIVLIP